jgi:hypothetical protein
MFDTTAERFLGVVGIFSVLILIVTAVTTGKLVDIENNRDVESAVKSAKVFNSVMLALSAAATAGVAFYFGRLYYKDYKMKQFSASISK